RRTPALLHEHSRGRAGTERSLPVTASRCEGRLRLGTAGGPGARRQHGGKRGGRGVLAERRGRDGQPVFQPGTAGRDGGSLLCAAHAGRCNSRARDTDSRAQRPHWHRPGCDTAHRWQGGLFLFNPLRWPWRGRSVDVNPPQRPRRVVSAREPRGPAELCGGRTATQSVGRWPDAGLRLESVRWLWRHGPLDVDTYVERALADALQDATSPRSTTAPFVECGIVAHDISNRRLHAAWN